MQQSKHGCAAAQSSLVEWQIEVQDEVKKRQRSTALGIPAAVAARGHRMAPPDGTDSWLENDENVVMRVNLCCEGGPCRWTHQPGERPPLALQGRVSQEMWTEFLTECKRDLAKYDKHKLAWISVPLIWLALLHVIPQAAHDIAVPIISIFCIVLMLVTFCLIKSRVEAAFGDIYRRWSPRFRERGLVMWHQTKIVETKGRRGKNTKTIQWYDIRPNPYEVTPAPEPYEIRPNPETVTAARQMQHLYGYGDEVSAAVQMQQVRRRFLRFRTQSGSPMV